MSLQIDEISLEMSEQVTELLSNINPDGDDCFNVVVESDRINIILCMQYFNKSHIEKYKEDFSPFMFKDLTDLVIELRQDGGILDLTFKSAQPAFMFANIEIRSQEFIIPIAQRVLSYLEKLL